MKATTTFRSEFRHERRGAQGTFKSLGSDRIPELTLAMIALYELEKAVKEAVVGAARGSLVFRLLPCYL